MHDSEDIHEWHGSGKSHIGKHVCQEPGVGVEDLKHYTGVQFIEVILEDKLRLRLILTDFVRGIGRRSGLARSWLILASRHGLIASFR